MVLVNVIKNKENCIKGNAVFNINFFDYFYKIQDLSLNQKK